MWIISFGVFGDCVTSTGNIGERAIDDVTVDKICIEAKSNLIN